MTERPVLIMAGGTGGHVFPALTVARLLRQRGVPVVWLGTAAGLESRVVPAAGFDLRAIPIQGLRGKGRVALMFAPWRLLRALGRALAIIAALRPRAVLGMGGFVAGPGGVASWLLRRPLVIHEQNAVAGLTNRYLSRLARQVLAAFPGAFDERRRAHVVGNPVRAEICTLAPPQVRMAGRQGPARVLVLGGSQGAAALNRVVPAALARLPADIPWQSRHQCGSRHLQSTLDAYEGAGGSVEVVAFIEDMAEAYGWADLVICRAGAMTVSELAAAGVAALLVPYPHAVDDHQARNAEFLTRAGGAVMWREEELDADRLCQSLAGLLSDRRGLIDRACRARAQARPEAAEEVVRCLLSMTEPRA